MANLILDPYGKTIPRTDDPAFQPPVDPTQDRSALRRQAQLVYRDLSVSNIVDSGWTVRDVRSAIMSLGSGMFERPALLCEALSGDSRVDSALLGRMGALLSRPIQFRIPRHRKNDPAAKRCLRDWREAWQRMNPESELRQLKRWSDLLGFGLSTLDWDHSGSYSVPYLRSFNPRFTWYSPSDRKYIAVTQDGQVGVTPGNGSFVLHTPHGPYRGWLNGALRSTSMWWLARSYALRDWARASEKHGMPTILGSYPAGADQASIDNFRTQMLNLGQESVVSIPTSAEPQIGSFGMEYIESQSTMHAIFGDLIAQCNTEITMSILGQNLTSEVKEGSLAAARVHANVMQAIVEMDARAMETTLYQQIIRPFAALNYGDPDLAPVVKWDVSVPEDQVQKSQVFVNFSTGVENLIKAGFTPKDLPKLADTFGLKLGEFTHEAPILPGAPGTAASPGDKPPPPSNGTQPSIDAGEEKP